MFGDVHSAQAAVSLLVILHRYTFHCRPLVAVANSRVKAAVRSTGRVELARVTGGAARTHCCEIGNPKSVRQRERCVGVALIDAAERTGIHGGGRAADFLQRSAVH